jgi:hypothetical protein
MGVTKFRDIGEVADAGFADGISGKVNDYVHRLPRDCLYWIAGTEPTSYAPYATWKEGRVVIDVRDDCVIEANQPALGLRLPTGAVKNERASTDISTLFDYKGVTYEIVHRTIPL